MSNRKQLIKKFCFANVILAFLNSYVVFRLAEHASGGKHKFISLIFVLILLALQNIVYLPSQWLTNFEHYINSKKTTSLAYQTSYLLFGVMTSMFCYMLAMDIFNIILKFSGLVTFSAYINKYYFITITSVTCITIILGIRITIRGPNVERVTIALKNLPRGFKGFKIVQVSDLHVGKVIRHNYVLNVVHMVNSLNPDIIALTGDFVDGTVQELEDDINILNRLKSRHGSFFVTGNHEYYSGAPIWIQKFKDLGIKVLLNEHVLINHNNDQVIFAGVTDYSTLKNQLPNASSPHKALEGAPRHLVKILLAHQPISYIQAHNAGYDLQLSGHTHAGQYFPFTLLIRFFHRYYRGLNNHKGMWLYINKGTGYWGPPLRFGASPEITLITLESMTNK